MPLTLQDYVNAFEAANAKAIEADNLQGNPTRWGVIRGIQAVIALERDRCAKLVEADATTMFEFKRLDNAEALMDIAARIKSES